MGMARLGRYELIEELGRGGMATVYRAHDPRFKREVAIKVLPREMLHNPHFRARFEREAETIASLQHTNIVPVYDFGEEDGQLYLVMRYMTRGTLGQRIRQGPIALHEVVKVIDQLAPALDKAHRQGIIHRDLKPDNIMFDEDGTAHIADFGLAKLAEERGHLTGSGAVLGTPAYMSPEQVMGQPIDARSDLYSLGLIVFEMLTGQSPFSVSTPMGYLSAHLNQTIPDIHGLLPDLPAALNDAIQKAAAKDREARYNSAAELAADLHAALETKTRPVVPIRHPSQTNLPAQPTSLIGREREAAEILDLLRRSDVRLVTLTGPGGIGKTRLALRVAADLLGEYRHGVYFAPLAPITDPELVVPTIAGVLGVQVSAGQPILDTLRSYLSGRQMLLVLDNFEQISSAASVISELIAAAPELKVMATSREVLHLYGEHGYAVPPLALPDTGRDQTAAALSGIEAVGLFVQRAKAANASFALTDEAAPAVAEICVRLDGLPLAIELAAARSRMLPPPLLLERLSSRLSALTGGALDLPARQQTLRRTIDWSYSLLDEGEKLLFARLAVFVGGWTLDAAETVCAEGLPFEVLDGLESLLDKSLIRQTEGAGSEPRFAMLETIREYAADKLGSSGEADPLRSRHAAYVTSLVEQVHRAGKQENQQFWIQRLDDEQGNIRAAMIWALQSRAIETAMRISAPLWWYYHLRVTVLEYSRWLQEVIALDPGVPPALRAQSLRAWSNTLAYYGNPSQEAIGPLQEEALSIYRQLGNQEGVSAMLNNLGVSAAFAGDLPRARSLYEEALAQQGRSESDDATTRSNLGWLAALEGRFEEARQVSLETENYFRSHNLPLGLATELQFLGTYALWAGDPEGGRGTLEEAIQLARELDDVASVPLRLSYLGLASILAGKDAQARQELQESLRLAAALPRHNMSLRLLSSHLLWLGGAASARQPERAARLLSAGMAVPRYSYVQWPPDRAIVERFISETRARLDPPVFDAAWAEGQAMTLEQAIAYALEEDTA